MKNVRSYAGKKISDKELADILSRDPYKNPFFDIEAERKAREAQKIMGNTLNIKHVFIGLCFLIPIISFSWSVVNMPKELRNGVMPAIHQFNDFQISENDRIESKVFVLERRMNMILDITEQKEREAIFNNK